MAVDIDIVHLGELRTRSTHRPSGVTLETDAPLDNGGKGGSFSPTDLVATGLGNCTLTVMDLWARRHGIDLSGTRAHVVKEMVADPVRRIGRLTVKIEIPASRVPGSAERTALERAAHGCPVKASLHPDVRVDLAIEYVQGP